MVSVNVLLLKIALGLYLDQFERKGMRNRGRLLYLGAMKTSILTDTNGLESDYLYSRTTGLGY